ncbi:MAG: hypothetical protein ACE5J0_02615 [Candidatus Paceibacterales bacterium]
MNYKEAGNRLRPVFDRIWNGVASGIYPESYHALQAVIFWQQVRSGDKEKAKKGFWSLLSFLCNNLLLPSAKTFPKEMETIRQLLKELDDKPAVKRGLKLLKKATHNQEVETLKI